MSEETRNPIMDVAVKVLLALGIFTVAAKDGKHEYVFDLGLNLTVVVIFVIFVFALLRIFEFTNMNPKSETK